MKRKYQISLYCNFILLLILIAGATISAGQAESQFTHEILPIPDFDIKKVHLFDAFYDELNDILILPIVDSVTNSFYKIMEFDFQSEVWSEFLLNPNPVTVVDIVYDPEDGRILAFPVRQEVILQIFKVDGAYVINSNEIDSSIAFNDFEISDMVLNTITRELLYFRKSGSNLGSIDRDVWVLDLETDVWSQIMRPNYPPVYYQGDFVFDPYRNQALYLYTTETYSSEQNTTWLFDFETMAWSEFSSDVFPSSKIPKQLVYNSRNNIYLSYDIINNYLYGFDPDSGIWIYLAALEKLVSEVIDHVSIYHYGTNSLIGYVNSEEGEKIWFYKIYLDQSSTNESLSNITDSPDIDFDFGLKFNQETQIIAGFVIGMIFVLTVILLRYK